VAFWRVTSHRVGVNKYSDGACNNADLAAHWSTVYPMILDEWSRNRASAAAAEKSGLKAEHVDLRSRYPELHLLLAEIFARKNNYARAITEIQTYLALAPHAKDADQVREQLVKLEKLNGPGSTSEKPDQR
jgi:hypothetical protein